MSRRVLEGYGLPMPSGGGMRMGSRPRRVPRVLSAFREAVAKYRQRFAEPVQETVPSQRQLFLGREATILREMLMVVQAHARARRTVILKYRKQEDGSLIVREIEPYSIRLKNTKKYGRRRYLYGYDLFRGEIRAFILGNMQSVRGTNNTFNPRWEVEF